MTAFQEHVPISVTYQNQNLGTGIIYRLYADVNNITEQNIVPVMVPTCHLRFDRTTNQYHLDAKILLQRGREIDGQNIVVVKCLGKDVLIFLNFKPINTEDINNEGIQKATLYIYRIQFNSDISPYLRGKHITCVPVYGDPEEGSVTKVIVEDEDEI